MATEHPPPPPPQSGQLVSVQYLTLPGALLLQGPELLHLPPLLDILQEVLLLPLQGLILLLQGTELPGDEVALGNHHRLLEGVTQGNNKGGVRNRRRGPMINMLHEEDHQPSQTSELHKAGWSPSDPSCTTRCKIFHK